MNSTQSDSIVKLAAALVAFQAEEKTIKKNAVNPFYHSKYSTLDAIWDVVRPLLAKHELAIIQLPVSTGFLETTVLHASGEYISATSHLAMKEVTPQGQGSSIHYLRRYALCAVLGLTSDDDDDANAATKPAVAPAKVAPKATPVASAPNAVPTPASTAAPTLLQFAPCTVKGCTATANLRFGTICYPHSQAAKKKTKAPAEEAVPVEGAFDDAPPIEDIPF